MVEAVEEMMTHRRHTMTTQHPQESQAQEGHDPARAEQAREAKQVVTNGGQASGQVPPQVQQAHMLLADMQTEIARPLQRQGRQEVAGSAEGLQTLIPITVVGVLRHRVLARVVQAIRAAGRIVLALEGRVEGEVINTTSRYVCIECAKMANTVSQKHLSKSKMLVHGPSLLDIPSSWRYATSVHHYTRKVCMVE